MKKSHVITTVVAATAVVVAASAFSAGYLKAHFIVTATIVAYFLYMAADAAFGNNTGQKLS